MIKILLSGDNNDKNYKSENSNLAHVRPRSSLLALSVSFGLVIVIG